MTTREREHPLEAELGGPKLQAPKVRVRKFKKDFTTYFLESVHEKFHSDAHEQYQWLLRKNRRAAEITYIKTKDPFKDDFGIRIRLSPLSAKTQVFNLDYQLKGPHEMYEPWGTEWIKIGNPLMIKLHQILKEHDALQLYRVVASMEEWLKQPIQEKYAKFKTWTIKRGLQDIIKGEALFSPLIESVDTDATAESYISATSGKVRRGSFSNKKKLSPIKEETQKTRYGGTVSLSSSSSAAAGGGGGPSAKISTEASGEGQKTVKPTAGGGGADPQTPGTSLASEVEGMSFGENSTRKTRKHRRQH